MTRKCCQEADLLLFWILSYLIHFRFQIKSSPFRVEARVRVEGLAPSIPHPEGAVPLAADIRSNHHFAGAIPDGQRRFAG